MHIFPYVKMNFTWCLMCVEFYAFIKKCTIQSFSMSMLFHHVWIIAVSVSIYYYQLGTTGNIQKEIWIPFYSNHEQLAVLYRIAQNVDGGKV